MHWSIKTIKPVWYLVVSIFVMLTLGCSQKSNPVNVEEPKVNDAEYFLFRPEFEKSAGYTHAVKAGNSIKISGAVSMDDKGVIIAPGNMEQQIKNCYSDLEKILNHYGCTFDDVVSENIYTTNTKNFLAAAAYRNSIYKKQFPTATFVEVKGLAGGDGQLVEIQMEAYKSK